MQIVRRFLAARINGTIHLVYVGAIILGISVLILGFGLVRGSVQAIGPLKVLAGDDPNSSASQRFLIVTDIKDSSQVALRQAGTHAADPRTAKDR